LVYSFNKLENFNKLKTNSDFNLTSTYLIGTTF